MLMSLLCIALLIPVISAVRPTTDLSDTEAPQLDGITGKELLKKLDLAFQGKAVQAGIGKSPVAGKVNFIFLDKDGTQTPPADYQDTDFKQAWNDANEQCQNELKKRTDIQVVTATGQPFFMWKITVGSAPYAVLSGGNAWVINSKQEGSVTISAGNLGHLMTVEKEIAGGGNTPLHRDTKFYYMNQGGMYSLAENKKVDEEFFGYIAKTDDIKNQLRTALTTKEVQPLQDIEILYVKHCGKNSPDHGLINNFFIHLQKYFMTIKLTGDEPVNGQVWELTRKGENQRLKAMIMMTGSYCEIAISAGDKSTGMERLLNEVKGANVVMGAGDSGNDVPLQKLVTGKGSYFVASPAKYLLEKFSASNPPQLEYDAVFKSPESTPKTVPGLWFQLPRFWKLC
mmetsp:Transcript_14897/g.42770  ORF Transcript_14897/g.42770 Transcript_14897/m.42770 type:complete len:398 (-) Transcript_14897:203-1396(-)